MITINFIKGKNTWTYTFNMFAQNFSKKSDSETIIEKNYCIIDSINKNGELL